MYVCLQYVRFLLRFPVGKEECSVVFTREKNEKKKTTKNRRVGRGIGGEGGEEEEEACAMLTI